MARKSNKTAHVLNLIAGHDNQQEAAEESTAADAPAASPAKPAASAPAVSAPVQNISVIDTTAEDPVADLIQQQLTNQFDGQTNEVPLKSEPPSQSEEKPEPQTQQETQPEPEIALEPAFARVNVMEKIVNDKIIYFMRQFDVCTCERCIADTCALTLSGLLPKYIVTAPAAVDPLLSYYTNKYISDVTVEATKACMIVKDNPRH